MGLRRLLTEAGLDLARDGITIAPVPGSLGAGVNFGVTAAKALEDRKIDGFWANGMGAEVAVRRGVGTVVLDVRRGDGPQALLQLHDGVDRDERRADRAVAGDRRRRGARAWSKTQEALKADPSRATEVGRSSFPPIGGRADRRAHPPRPALLRRVDLARIRRRHEPVCARGRYPEHRRSVRSGRRKPVSRSVDLMNRQVLDTLTMWAVG